MFMKKVSFSNTLYVLLSFLGILLMLLSKNLLLCWMGFELNLMAILPLMSASDKNKFFNYFNVSLTMMYLVYQSLGTLLFSMGSLNESFKYFIFFGLSLKLGVFPLVLWFPSFMNKLNWYTLAFFCTTQKIGGLYLLVLVSPDELVILGFSLMVCLVGLLKSFSNLKYLLAWSSMLHTCFVMFLGSLNFSLASWYFLFSCIKMMVVCLAKLSLYYLGDEYKFDSYKNFVQSFSMLNLTGLPIFSGLNMKLVFFSTLKLELSSSVPVMVAFSMMFFLQMLVYLRYLFNMYQSSRVGSFSSVVQKTSQTSLLFLMFVCLMPSFYY